MPSRQKPANKTLVTAAAALLCGLLLRLVFLRLHPQWGGDTLVYGDLAENMLRHHVFGFSEQTLRPTLIRLPGYPIFLAACFLLFGHANYLAAACVQIALDLLGCILLSLLAARLFTPRAGLITLWFAALCPFTANYTAAALTETVSIFCVTLSLFALERWSTTYKAHLPDLATQDANPIDRSPRLSEGEGAFRPLSQNYFGEGALAPGLLSTQPTTSTGNPGLALGWPLVIGLSFAFAVLVRPDQGLLAAAVVPAMLWLAFTTPSRTFTERLAPAATASLIVILPLLLWGIRNYSVFGVFQPLAPRYANDPGEAVDLGFQRWYRTWGVDFKSTYDVYWAYDGSSIDLATLPPRAFDTPAQRAETFALIRRYNVEQSASPAFDAAFTRIAEERIAAHPLRSYVLMPLAREANMWLRPRTELIALRPPIPQIPLAWWNFAPHPAASTFALFYALLNAAYLALAFTGVLRWSRTLWKTHAPLMIATLGFVLLRSALLLNLDNSEPRYTLECFPVVFLFAAASFLSTPQIPSAPRN